MHEPLQDSFAALPLTHTPRPDEYPGHDGQVPSGSALDRARARAIELLMQPAPAGRPVVAPVPLPGSDALAFTVDGLFTPEECAALVEMAETAGFYPAPVNVDGDKYRLIPELRNNHQTMLDDAATAALLWGRVSECCPLRMDGRVRAGLNERMRYLRYDAGQKFEVHLDGPYVRPEGPRQNEQSALTFQLYLSDGFQEGTTRFPGAGGRQVDVVPRAGRVLAFAHGVLHTGVPPMGGRKYVLRTEVMYAPDRFPAASGSLRSQR